MRVLMSVLVALLGALVGAAIGVAVTYALLSGQGADALTWLAAGVFFCLPAMFGLAVAAGLVCRRLFPAVFLGSRAEPTLRRRYGIGASVVYGISGTVLALALAVLAVEGWSLAERGTSAPNLLAGNLCKKPGVRYLATTAQGVQVCFTLTTDRSRWVEIAWRFSSASGCPGGSRPGWAGATSYDWGNALDSAGGITEPDFTAA